MNITDEEFDQLITRAMNELPQKYIEGLDNVAIVQADEPTEEQKIKMKLDDHHLLLGLYEVFHLLKGVSGIRSFYPIRLRCSSILFLLSHTMRMSFLSRLNVRCGTKLLTTMG